MYILTISIFIVFQHGEISCRPVECPVTSCKNPVLHPGKCCPTCLSMFIYLY